MLFNTAFTPNHITQNRYLKLNVAPNVVCVVDRTRTKDSVQRKEDVVRPVTSSTTLQKMCRSRAVSNEKPAQKKSYRRPKQRARAVTTEGAESQSEESGPYEEQYTVHVGSVSSNSVLSDKPLFKIKIANTPICIMAESGATVNIINEKDYLSITPRPTLLPSTTEVYPYMSSKPLELCGTFESDVTSNEEKSHGTFYVAKGPSRSLLSWKMS